MKTFLKRTGILCLWVWLFSLSSYATVYSGNCGIGYCDSLKWKLNTETGKLEVYGKYSAYVARMTDFIYNDAPWYDYRDYIQTVKLSGISYIGKWAFGGCYNLQKVIVPDIAAWCGMLSLSGDSNPLNYAHHLYSDDDTEITDLIIPEGVTRISNAAFYGCSGLTSVTIPNSVTAIGENAFCGCGLKSLTIPNSVTSIGEYAFRGCSSLASVIIGSGMTSIGEGVFYDCSGLITVTIGSGVLSINDYAFYNAHPKKIIWLPNTPPSGYRGSNETMNYVANNNYTGLSNGTVYPFLSSMFEVEGIKYVPVSPSERTCDAIDCAYDESAENIDIGETVTNKGITFSVKQIKPYICFGNKFIKNIKLNYIGDISAYAFANCGSQTVLLGNGIASIGLSSFSGCTNLKRITIPDAISSISSHAFYGCLSMTYIKIGTGVKKIQTYALANCSSLQSIRIPHNVTAIEDNVFENCKNLKNVWMEDGDAKLKLGSNYKNPLFSSCPLDSVYIGRNITYPTSSDKGYSPFYNSKSLKSVIISDKETEITTRMFCGCSNIKKIEIPNSVLSLGSNAFEGCSSMTSVKIGNGVTLIDTYAFSGCSSLPAIIIPSSVIFIGDNTFKGCSSLKNLIIER